MRSIRPSFRLAALTAPALALGLGACASASSVPEWTVYAGGDPAPVLPAAAAERAPSDPAADPVAARTSYADLVDAVTAARIASALEPQDGGAGAEVVSTAPRVLSEDDPVGVYGQPEWTAHRRWVRTRAYVLPEGQVEFEQWWRGTFDHGEGPGHLFQSEIGIGLPHRFQFDLYGNFEHEDGTTKWTTLQPELRWALANWGEIPLNPTLYAEYKWQHHANDVAEGKILFAEDIADGIHWAGNLSVEQELGGEREQELAITQAIAVPVVDRRFSVGVELEYDRVTVKGGRDDAEDAYYVGPSFQWRPTENTHLDIVPLRGLHDAHDWRIFVVFGIDFGGAKPREASMPVSSKSR